MGLGRTCSRPELLASFWSVFMSAARLQPSSCAKLLQGLYKIAGLKGQPVCFIFTDAEVKDDAFLEYINQMLMTGGQGTGGTAHQMIGPTLAQSEAAVLMLPALVAPQVICLLASAFWCPQERSLGCLPRTS